MFERFRNRPRARSRAAAARPATAIRALEPRYVFDAAAAPAAAAAAQAAEAPAPDHPAAEAAHPAESPAPDHAPSPAADASAAAAERREIVVIDRNVPDLQTLLRGVPEKAEVLLIDSARDGFDQLAEALRGRSDVDAVHILSHGAAGDLRLGTGTLTADTIAGRYAEDLVAIGRALGPDGDLLIYGCDFGAGAKGAEAVRLLARATGADVAASDDATGDATLGGDWDLETRTGAIEAGPALDAPARETWHHLLAPAQISITGEPTVLDGSGALITAKTTRATNNGSVDYFDVDANLVGATATWANAGTVGGVAVSLRATVVSIGEGDDTVSFGTSNDDTAVLLRSTSTTNGTPSNAAHVVLRWDLVRADNGQPIAADIDFRIGDIDGINGNPNTRESVTAAQTGLTSYTVDQATHLTLDSRNDLVRASGTQNENVTPPDPVSIIGYNWTNVSSWTMTYDLAANTQTGGAAFIHDGDRDIAFNTPVTVTIPKVDLDADDSAGSGLTYATQFTENGPAVGVTDTDVLIANTPAVDGAEIILRNAKAGDDLIVGALPGTLTAGIDRSVAGVIKVTLSGNGSLSDYQNALKAVTFANSDDLPDTTDRQIDVRVSNGTTQGTSSRTTISVVPVDDAPVNTVPPPQTMQEYTSLVFSSANGNAISVADADAGASSIKVTITAGNGIVTLARTTGLGVTGDGTGTVTLTGSISDINAALDGAAYRPNTHFAGSTAVTVATDDLGNTGPGGPKTTTSQALITVQANAEAPTIGARTGTEPAREDTPLVFSPANGNAITVADRDGGALTVTISANHGVLTLARTTGLTITVGDGADDARMTFSGLASDINAALDGLRFDPDDDYNGPAQIALSVQDLPRAADNFTNGSFEQPGEPPNSYTLVDDSSVPGWKTTASDHKIEIWGTGWNGVPAYEGNQFAEINATEVAALYQDFDASPGSIISLDFAHRGRQGVDTMRVVVTDLGADGVYGTGDDIALLDKNYLDGNAAWGAYHEELSQGASGNKLRFEFRSVSAEGNDPTYGNFVDGIRINQNFITQRTIDLAIAPVADIVADTVATNEDNAVTFNALTGTNGASADNFEDPGAFVSSVTNGAHGRVSFQPDGRLTYTPDPDFNGTDTFTYTVTSGGTTETATVTVGVAAVNDAPQHALPAGASTNEDTDLVLSGANAIRVSDVDAGTGSLTTRLGVAHGTLTLAPGSGAGVSGDGTGSVTLTGTLAQINAALDGLRYRPGADYNGPDTLTLVTDDLGNTGAGGPLSRTDTLALTVVAVADSPVVSVPAGTQAASEDTARVFSVANGNAVTVSDPDGGSLTVTLGSDHGRLTLAAIAGLTFSSGDGTGDRTMTLTGSIADINAALDGLRFDPDDDYNGPARISLVTRDPLRAADNFTNGGFEQPAIAAGTNTLQPDSAVPGWKTDATDRQIEIWNSGFNGVQAYEGNQFAEINANEVAALFQTFDAAQGSRISLDFAHRGRQGVDTMRVVVTDLGADGVYGTGDDIALLDKNYSDGNAAWGAYHEELSQGASGNKLRFEFRSVSAAGGSPSIGNFVDGIRINQNFEVNRTIDLAIAPVADIVADTVATSEDNAVTFNALTGTNGASADNFEDPGAFVSSVTNGAHGRVSFQPDGRLTYTPDPDFNGTDTFTYTVTSGGTTETATVTVGVAAVNDAPQHALPAGASTNEDTDLVLSGANAIRVSDVDAGTASLTTRLGVAHGTLTLAPGSGAGVSGDGTGSVTLTGTLAQINAALDGLRYRPGADYNGPDTLTLVTDDLGNTGAGGPLSRTDTLAIAVAAVNDAPRTGPLTARGSVDGAAVSVDLGASYNDPEGDPITYTVTGLPPGLSADPTTGRVSGRIDRSASQGGAGGLYTVQVRATDGQGGITDATFTWRVLNPAPIARNDTFLAEGGRSLTGSVLADNGNGPDADPDGDPLAIVAVGGRAGDVGRGVAGSAGGIFTVEADGRYAFDPGADFADLAPGATRTTTLTYTVSDGEGGLATAQVSVTVAGRIPALPAPSPLDLASNDGQPLRLDLAALFPGREGLTYAAAGLPPGLALDPATGLVSGTVASDASGPTGLRGYPVTLTATDPAGASETRTLTWRIANLPPAAAADAASTAEDTPLVIDVRANDADPDGDPLTLVAADGLAPSALHGRVDVVGGRLVYVPDAHFNGQDRITYTVSDGNGGLSTATVDVTVTPVNDAPEAGSLPDTVSRDGQTITYPIAPNFSDPDTDPRVAQGTSGGGLTFSAAGLPPGLSIDPSTGLVSGTLPANASATPDYRVTVTATDRNGASVGRSFTWHVDNGAPVAAPDAAATVQGRPVIVAVTANDGDPDGDAFALVADPGRATAAHGSVGVDPASGTLTYTPDPGFRGTDTITYTIRDAQGDEGTGFLTVSVGPVNQRPTAPDSLAARVAADADRVDLDLGAAFADPDGDSLAYTATGLPPGLTIDPATGRVTGRVDASASGPDGSRTYVVEVTARDAGGLSVTRAFAWTVVDPPPEAVNDTIATAEETPVDIEVVKAGAAPGTPGQDTDPDGDPLAVVPGSLRAAHGSVGLNPDGTIRYRPDADFNGTDTILYTVSDGNGGFSTGAVTVTVGPVNDAPVAGPLADRGGADAEVIDLATAPAFSDVDTRDHAPGSVPDRLSYSATGLPPGLSIDPDTGRITGRLASDASTRVPGGLYTVTVTARDLAGAAASSTFTFAARNIAPSAGDDAFAGDEDAPLTGSVLGNDADPDGDPVAVAILRGPAHGTLDLRPDGRFTYVPDADYNGPDSFTYTFRDADGAAATATVTLAVRPVNDPPEAGAPPLVTPEDTPVDGRLSLRDVDGDPLTVAVEQAPRSGSLILRPDGSYTYLPNRDFHGSDSFTLRVADPNGGVTLVTVPVTVDPVNDVPEASADPLTLPANTSAGGRIVASDRDGDRLAFRLAAPPANGSLALAADGGYVYEPYDGYYGPDQFKVLVSDGQGGETLVTVAVTVTPNPIEVRPPMPPAALMPPSPLAPPPGAGRDASLLPPPALTATGIVLPTVAAFGRLESVSDVVLAEGAVVAAVNGVRSLNGIDIVPVRPAIQQETERLARLGSDGLVPEIGLETPWFSARPFIGRSLGFTLAEETGAGGVLRDVVVEAIRRPDAFGLSLRNLAPDAAGIAAVTLRGADGGPAPSWLETDGRGSFWGRPPAGGGRVSVAVEFTLSDGRVIRQPLDLDTETGEIRAGRKPAPAARAAPPPTEPETEARAPLFTDQLGAAELRASRELDLIEQALAGTP